MRIPPHKSQTEQKERTGARHRSFFVVLTVALSLIAAACGSSEADTALLDPIETNDGGVLVRPPDVLEGNPEPTPDPLAQATTPPVVVEDPVVTEEPAPAGADSVAFEYFDGSPGSTADFVGQPTVLNFWASNCPACIREMPEFEEVSLALAGQVDFIGMNVNDTSRDDAIRLAEQTGVTYPLAYDTNAQVFGSVFGFVMPTTVFLDDQGDVAFVWSGVLTGSELQNLIAEHIAPGVETDA